MPTLRYVHCDVFTDRPLSGNQLAVFTDARGLSSATMQALAAEMNFSESVFVLRPEQGGHARIRIFTPVRELPFAGHPTLGAAFVLGGPLQTDTVRLETGAGMIPVRLEREGARVVFGWMVQPTPRVMPFAETAALFAALGVAGSGLPVELYELGPRHVYVALESKAEVARLAPDLKALGALGDFGINTFAGAGSAWKTRMFAPSHGVDEDPATGSAAGPLALHLVRHGRIDFGQSIVIEQGTEIGRPSQLHARVERGAGGVPRVEVGGAAVILGRGELRVPG
jgi:trans-2,3-dihydro-3-hydroxyanthranilate isomerase